MNDRIKFAGKFDEAGDTLVLRFPLGRHVLTVTASVEVDDHQNIRDEDRDFDPEWAAAWHRGEWKYMSVVVALAINGEEFECKSLHGIDCGDDPRYLLCVANDLAANFTYLPLRGVEYPEAYAPIAVPLT